MVIHWMIYYTTYFTTFIPLVGWQEEHQTSKNHAPQMQKIFEKLKWLFRN